MVPANGVHSAPISSPPHTIFGFTGQNRPLHVIVLSTPPNPATTTSPSSNTPPPWSPLMASIAHRYQAHHARFSVLQGKTAPHAQSCYLHLPIPQLPPHPRLPHHCHGPHQWLPLCTNTEPTELGFRFYRVKPPPALDLAFYT